MTRKKLKITGVARAYREEAWADELRARRARGPSQSVVMTWRCANPHCGEWTPEGSYNAGYCLHCGTSRAA